MLSQGVLDFLLSADCNLVIRRTNGITRVICGDGPSNWFRPSSERFSDSSVRSGSLKRRHGRNEKMILTTAVNWTPPAGIGPLLMDPWTADPPVGRISIRRQMTARQYSRMALSGFSKPTICSSIRICSNLSIGRGSLHRLNDSVILSTRTIPVTAILESPYSHSRNRRLLVPI